MARQNFVQKEFAKNVQFFQICSARVHVFVQTISQIIVPGGAGARKNDVMRKLLIVKHRRLFLVFRVCFENMIFEQIKNKHRLWIVEKLSKQETMIF